MTFTLRTVIEPFRIRSVAPIRFTTEAQRAAHPRSRMLPPQH
jgi:hypothetical protein